NDQYDNTADATVYSGYDDTTAEAADAPVLTANDDGSVTAQPGDDNIQHVITHVNEADTPVTLTATKAENGSWTLDNTPTDVSIDAITGVVTLQPDTVTAFTQIDSTGTDRNHTTADTTIYSGYDDTTAEAADAPVLTANDDGCVTSQPGAHNIQPFPTRRSSDLTPVTLTATKAENGSWTLDNTPTDVSIDAITGVVTLQP